MLQRKMRVLFLCTHNSCRSQMAEGWARHLHGDHMEPCSAGTEARGIDPRAAEVMAEGGVDIAQQRSKTLNELREEVGDVEFDHVITVCDAAQEACPVFPGQTKVMHMSFPDPPKLAVQEHDPDKAQEHYRRVRDDIRAFIQTLPEQLARD